MNKVLKGLVAVAATAAMAVAGFAGASTAMADGTVSIKITGQEAGHTYNAFQVFAGDYADGVLSNVTWGENITNGSQVITALKEDSVFGSDAQNIFASCSDAACVAKALSTETNDSVKAQEFAKVVGDKVTGTGAASTQVSSDTNGTKYQIKNLSSGYYIVKDAGDGDNTPHHTVYSRYLAKVVPGTAAEINTKESKPDLDKQIKHNEKTTDAWGVVGDNQIGDTVEFRTISTVPNTTGYNTYTYEINDTMSEELTSNVKDASGVTIKVNDTTTLDSKYYTVTVDTANANKFTVNVNILDAIRAGKLATGDKLYAYYSGVLNEKAKTYEVGPQSNTANLVYSNNPNGEGTGKTVDKTVYDWTFKVNVNKVDGESNELTGAKFVLSKTDITASDDAAVKAYNETSNIDSITGNWKTGSDQLIKFIKDSTENTYTVAPADYVGETTTVIDTDKPIIKGLDDATSYYLYETKSPASYNRKVEPTKFTIDSGIYSETGNTVSETKISVDNAEKVSGMTVNVVNVKGTGLPSTGGMGTVMLYVAGIAVFVLAGATLVMALRRRNA